MLKINYKTESPVNKTTLELKFGRWFTGRITYLSEEGTWVIQPAGFYHLESGRLYDLRVAEVENYKEVELRFKVFFSTKTDLIVNRLPNAFRARHKDRKYSIYVCQHSGFVFDLLRNEALYANDMDFINICPVDLEIDGWNVEECYESCFVEDLHDLGYKVTFVGSMMRLEK